MPSRDKSRRSQLRPGRIQRERSPRGTRRLRFPRAPRKPIRTLPRNPSSRLQRSIVKVSYTKNWKSKSWRAHGYYLQREGAQREGERGLGFNHERDDIQLAPLADSWQAAGDPHVFKLVV